MFIWIENGKYITAINKKLIRFFFSSITQMIFDWYWKAIWILKTILKITTFSGFSLIYLMIFWIQYPLSNFKSNSVSINKKNHIYIKFSLLNKTLHSVKSEIFSIKLWRKPIISNDYNFSDHENEIQFFRNHLLCPRILKMIRRNKLFNPPAQYIYIFKYGWKSIVVWSPKSCKERFSFYREMWQTKRFIPHSLILV